MVKITIDVDGGGSSHDFQAAPRAKAKRIGLVSAIKLESDMRLKFLAGAGLAQNDIEYGGDIDTKLYGKRDEIRQRKNDHKDKCDIIATIGGNYAFDAVNSDTPGNNVPFVSLVGSCPPTTTFNDKFRAAVSLESFNSNALRKAYLRQAPRSIPEGDIFLYTNKNSLMHAAEVANWASNATVCGSTAGGTGGQNDPAGFATDFTQGGLMARLDGGGAGPGSAAKGVIISDDPFFRAYRGQLISAVNTWIDGDAANRYVIYPSQIYGVTTGMDPRPRANKSTLYGPDLGQAVFLLGMIARYCAEPANQDTPLGVFSVPNVVVDIK